MPDSQRVLTLLSRAYCGLCDAMRDAVVPVAAAHAYAIEELDVDAHPELESRFGDLVPVLFLGAPEAGNELCHYHFDAARVAAALASASGFRARGASSGPAR